MSNEERVSPRRGRPERRPRPWRRAARAAGRFLLYANLHVGLLAVSLLLGTGALLGLPPDPALLLLAFCGTFLIYQADRALRFSPEDLWNQPQRLAWLRAHRVYVRGASAVALVAACAALPWLRSATLVAGLGLGLIGALYVLPLLPRRRRLKSIGPLKPVAIAGAWALGGVLPPILEAGASWTAAATALAAYRFLFILPNALLSDWPDRAGDAAAGLYTVAARLPASRLRLLASASLLTAIFGAVVAVQAFGASPLLYLDALGPALLLGVVARPWPAVREHYELSLDIPIAWPAVTALAAALAC